VLGGRFWSRGKMGFSVGLPQVTAMLAKKDVALRIESLRYEPKL